MRCVDCLPLIEEYFDGEVEGAAAEQMSAHLSSCADCSAALDALSFEQEVYARYERGLEVTPALWARVSAEIARDAAPESRAEQRPFLTRARAGLAAWLSTLAARPALASSFALLLVGVAAGSLWLAYVRRETPTPARVAVNTPPAPALKATAPPSESGGGGRGSEAKPSETPLEVATIRRGESPAESATPRGPKPPRPAPSPEEDLNSLLNAPTAQADAGIVRIKYDGHETRPEDSPAFVKVGGDGVGVVTANAQPLDPSEKEVARHVEQAQMLLRSIKNARADGGGAFNVAYERKLSRRLLSDNATLQLDADARGDKDTRQVLDRIEPYLLDIANMPDNASREEVRSMRERIDRKEIIAALQVY
ncbi:MAG TPA: zf-HC2 domain-containing protein [Pyrinomonadaceae bacterium]|jgi:hypothetical protein|nr:zf-HC2 domain-containing protein [Pyrinomonadaceae bacterium]